MHHPSTIKKSVFQSAIFGCLLSSVFTSQQLQMAEFSSNPGFEKAYFRFTLTGPLCTCTYSLFWVTLNYYTQLHKMHGCAMKKCNQPSWPPLKIHSPMSALMLFICTYSSLTTNVDHRFDLKGKNNRGANREFIDFRTFHTDISTVESQQFNHLRFRFFLRTLLNSDTRLDLVFYFFCEHS